MSAKKTMPWIGLLAVLVPTASNGAAAQGDERAFKPASQCPILFGGPAEIERNKKARLQHLETIEPGEYMINLTHTGPWQKPTIFRLQGVELVATAGLEGDRPTALVEVGALPEGLNCQPGLYEIGVDSSIGGQAHVLAIVDGAVLLAYKSELRYLQTRTASAPVFRMIWRSTWTIAGAAPAGSGPTPGPSSAASRHSSSRPSPASKSTTHRSTRKSPTAR